MCRNISKLAENFYIEILSKHPSNEKKMSKKYYQGSENEQIAQCMLFLCVQFGISNQPSHTVKNGIFLGHQRVLRAVKIFFAHFLIFDAYESYNSAN